RQHSRVIEKRKIKERDFQPSWAQGKKLTGKNNQVTVLIFISKNTVYLPWRKKMDTIALDGIRNKINLMFTAIVDKNTYFIITMPVRSIGFMWITLIVYFASFYLINLKVIKNLTPW